MSDKSLTLLTGERGEIGSFINTHFEQLGIPVMGYEKYCANPEKYGSPGRLIHLAARTSITPPNKLICSNINYLSDVINTCTRLRIKEFIFFSSASVYGQADSESVNESSPIDTSNLYAVSKLFGERLLASSTDINSLCLRIPGVLELRKNSNFISRTFNLLQNNREIEIQNGQRIFNHCLPLPVLAKFLVNVKLKDGHDIINLAAPRELTLISILEFVRKQLLSNSIIHDTGDYTPFFNLSIDKAICNYGFDSGNLYSELKQWCQNRQNFQQPSEHS